MSKWIRKDDAVVVIAGNDKGRYGKVLMRRADKVVVEGINKRTRHVKRSQTNPQGGRIQSEMAIDISNVAFCDQEGKALKVRVSISPTSGKELIAKQKGSEEFLLRTIRSGSKAGE